MNYWIIKLLNYWIIKLFGYSIVVSSPGQRHAGTKNQEGLFLIVGIVLKTQIVHPPPGRIELKPESTPNFYFADGAGQQIEIETGCNY